MKDIKKYQIEPEVILVHKPVGISSFTLLRKLRPLLGAKKIGHAGTLDPLASGLMIVGYNKGTKRMSHYLKLDKTYRADIFIGESTTTGDSEGEVIEKKKLPEKPFFEDEIEAVVQQMIGIHRFRVPLYSAIKVMGKPLYRYAREGKIPPYIPEKEMNVKSAQILDHYVSGDGYIIQIRYEVGSGTYIRTLAEILGQGLGYPARLQALYRYKIADYLDTQSFNLQEKVSSKAWSKYDILGVLSSKHIENTMNIDFQAQNCELSIEFRGYITRKLSKLAKFYNKEVTRIFIDIDQNTAIQSGPELFRVGIKVESPEVTTFTEEKAGDMRAAFDKAYKEILSITKTQRGRSQNLARRAGAKIKSLFKRLR